MFYRFYINTNLRLAHTLQVALKPRHQHKSHDWRRSVMSSRESRGVRQSRTVGSCLEPQGQLSTVHIVGRHPIYIGDGIDDDVTLFNMCIGGTDSS